MDYNLDVFNGHGVDSGEWFVEHDEFGVDGKAAGNLGASTFAAGELVAEVFAYFLEVNSAIRLSSFSRWYSGDFPVIWSTERMLSSTVILRNTDFSCARYPIPAWARR